jgi:hypothetical protein
MIEMVLVMFGNIECLQKTEGIVPIKSESRSEECERVLE